MIKLQFGDFNTDKITIWGF